MLIIVHDFLILGVAYLIGSIPFGILWSRSFKLEDPRTIGSKTIGATNVLRAGNKTAAALTLFCDALKGSIAVIFGLLLSPPLAAWAGIFAVLGHIWPLWLRFHGGKGVATTFGVILILSWPIAVACLVTWLAIALTTRYSSLSALISIGISPLYSIFLRREDLFLICLILGLCILVSHRRNIGRLITGKETKIGEKTTPLSSND